MTPRTSARNGQPAVYNATPPTLTDLGDSALNVDIHGHLKIVTSGYATPSDGSKNVTTAGTPVALVASSTPIKRVDIVAKYTNTDVVVVGASTVVAAAGTRRGVPLMPGGSYTTYVSDLASLFIDSVVNGEGVTFMYYY